MTGASDPHEWPASPKGRFSLSMLASTLLHAVGLALLLVLLPWTPEIPLMRLVLPVELVETIGQPGSPGDGLRTRPPAESAPAEPAPRLQAPAPPRAKPVVTSPVSPQPPRPAAAAPDPLEAKLKAFAQLRLPDAERPAAAKPRDGSGDAARDAGSRGTESGRGQGYSVKDVLRAQIERHWHIDRAQLGGAEMDIQILLTIDRDGGVRSVEVLADPKHAGDALHRALARSVRTAVLNSAPFHLPGHLADADEDGLRNVRLTLNPRKSLQ